MILDIRRLQHIFSRKGDVCLVDDKSSLPVGSDQSQQFGTVYQLAVRIVRVAYPAEILSFEREFGQIVRSREETDLMSVQAAGIFIFGERGDRNHRLRPLPGLRQEIESRDRAVCYDNIILFHLIPAGQ